MSFICKIVLAILVTILGVFPSFFTVAYNNNNGHFTSRFNLSGWILLALMVLTISLSVYSEFENEKDSKNTEQSLKNIKKALENKALNYDPVNKNITNNINSITGIGLTATGGGMISGIDMKDNKTLIHDNPILFNYYEMEDIINLLVKRDKITSKNAYLYYISNTRGKEFLSELEKVLHRMNYTVVEKGAIQPIPNELTTGVKIYNKNGNVMVVIGDFGL